MKHIVARLTLVSLMLFSVSVWHADAAHLQNSGFEIEWPAGQASNWWSYGACGRASWAAKSGSAGFSFYPAGNSFGGFGQDVSVNLANGDSAFFRIYGKAEANYTNPHTRIGMEFWSGATLQYAVTSHVYAALAADRGNWVELRIGHTNTADGIDRVIVRCDFSDCLIPAGTTEATCQWDDTFFLHRQPRLRSKFEPISGVYLGAMFEGGGSAGEIETFEIKAGKEHAVYGKFVFMKTDPFPWDWVNAVKAASPGAALHMVLEPMIDFEDTFAPDWGPGQALYEAAREFLTNCVATELPVFLRYAHEANGWWYPWHPDYSLNDNITPETYIQGWRNFAFLAQEVAPNVAMVWAPNQGNGPPDSGLPDYHRVYPGDDVVDWVGLSVYNGDWYGNSNEVIDLQFKKAIEKGYWQDDDDPDNDTLLGFYWTYSDPDNPDGHRKPMMIAETAAQFIPRYSITNAVQIAGFESLDGPVFIPRQVLARFSNLTWDAWADADYVTQEDFEDLSLWDWGPWGTNGYAWFNTDDSFSGTNALRMTGAPEAGGLYVGGNGRSLPAGTFRSSATLVNFQDLNHDAWIGSATATVERFETLAFWDWGPWGANRHTWSNSPDAVEGTNALRMSGAPEADSVYIGGGGRNLPEGEFVEGVIFAAFQNLNHDAWAGTNQMLVDAFEHLDDWNWGPWGTNGFTWTVSSDAYAGSYALSLSGAPESNGVYVGGNGRALNKDTFQPVRAIAEFQSLDNDGVEASNVRTADELDDPSPWNWGPWGDLYFSNTADRVQGTNAFLLGARTAFSSGEYVGGNGRNLFTNWSEFNGMGVWVKRDLSTNCNPILTFGLRSPFGTATVTKVISDHAWHPLKVAFTDMTIAGAFDRANITAFTLELLTTSSGVRPSPVWVDDWAGAVLGAPEYHDQDWWPGGPQTWPWGDGADVCVWTLVSDAAPELQTHSLRMAGTDVNANGYAGGNGCSLRPEDRDWSGVTNLAVTIRRASGSAVNPLLGLELVDGENRTASVSVEAIGSDYARVVVPYSDMTITAGFSWTNVHELKLTLLTTTPGSDPADLYIKRFELGHAADQLSSDWSTFDALEIWTKRGVMGVNPAVIIGVVSPQGTATVVRTVTNENYSALRIFKDEFDEQGDFAWTNITSLRLELLSTASNTAPAELLLDHWRMVALDLDDQDWWPGGAECSPWADDEDPAGWHTWTQVSDPSPGLLTNSLKMSGVDGNTNGYIGGNGASVVPPLQSWTGFSAMAFTVRRDGSGVDPKLGVELVDSQDLKANGFCDVASSTYSDVVIAFSGMSVEEGFDWDRIETVKLNMLTSSNGMPTADLLIKQWRLGGLVFEIPRDWTAYDAMELWVRRDDGGDPAPVLLISAVSPSGEGATARMVTNTFYEPLRIGLNELQPTGDFDLTKVTALKLEMLSSETNQAPADLFVDAWRLVKLDLSDQDWWPGGPECLPWAEDGDPAGVHTWSLVSDPAPGLMTNSLRMSGVDGNTNGYIGGNGFSVLGPQQSWSACGALCITARRASGAGADPIVAVELVDANARIAAGSMNVTETEYEDLVLMLSWMQADEGFDWDHVSTVKLSMMTSSNGAETADLYIKQWRLGHMEYDVPRDWSGYHAIEIMAKRSGGPEPDPVLVIGLISPYGSAGAPARITNTVYESARIYFTDCGPTPGFDWSRIDALKLEMLSSVSNAQPADLYVDSWRLVTLNMGDQNWWGHWGDASDENGGTNVWELVSDPTEGYGDRAFRISGTDRNTNYYIGGNGFSVVGPDRDWSAFTHLGLTMRRAGDTNLVNPQLQITVVDSASRTSIAYQVVYSSNYMDYAVALDSMNTTEGFNWSQVVNVALDYSTTSAGEDPDAIYLKQIAIGTVSNRYEQRWWKPGEPLSPIGDMTWTQTTDATEGAYALQISGVDPHGNWWIGRNGCGVNADQQNWTNSNALVFYAKRGDGGGERPDPRVEIKLDSDWVSDNGTEAKTLIRVGMTNWTEVVIPFSDFTVGPGFDFANVQVIEMVFYTAVGGQDPHPLLLDGLKRATVAVTNIQDNIRWKRDWIDQVYSLEDGASSSGARYVSLLREFRNIHMIGWFDVKKFEDGETKDFLLLEDGGVPVYSSYYAKVSNPYFLSRIEVDSDGDGLPDSFEDEHFGGPTDGDPWGDDDGDGQSNWAEYVAGTDPTDPDDFLHVSPVFTAQDDGGLLISWASRAGRLYELLKSTNLTQNFTTLELRIQATPPLNTYQDAQAVGDGPYFYRVRVMQ